MSHANAVDSREGGVLNVRLSALEVATLSLMEMDCQTMICKGSMKAVSDSDDLNNVFTGSFVQVWVWVKATAMDMELIVCVVEAHPSMDNMETTVEQA